MQEKYYRIEITLRDPNLVQKRRDILEKVEFLNKKLKEKGHYGRYGLKGLYCFSPIPSFAHCLTAVEEENGMPWLKDAIDEIQEAENEDREKRLAAIDKAVARFEKFSKEEDKKEYLETTLNYGKIGVRKGDLTVNNFNEIMSNKKQEKSSFSAKDYEVSELFIEPFKPTKNELKIEESYIASLSLSEQKSINAALRERFGAIKTWRPWKPGEKEEVAERFHQLDENFKKL